MKRIPFRYRLIQGAIGKRFVIKHYPGRKIVMTKYPDMSRIVPSEAQKMRRRLFTLAVRYAQKVFANPALKEEKRKTLRRPRRLFQALMKEWFAKKKEKAYYRLRRIRRWQRNLQQNTPATLLTDLFQLAGPIPNPSRQTHAHLGRGSLRSADSKDNPQWGTPSTKTNELVNDQTCRDPYWSLNRLVMSTNSENQNQWATRQ